MKRLWISLFLLTLLFSLCLANTGYLASFTGEVSHLLTRAEGLGERGDWESATQLTRQARQLWETHHLYLHTTLRHADLDNVFLYFLQVEEFLECREGGEYSAANAALLGQLELLREQEKLCLENIL